MKLKSESIHPPTTKKSSKNPSIANSFNPKRKKTNKFNSDPEKYNEDEKPDEHFSALELRTGDGDICSALMERYMRSSAPQHRHLCATAAAMRSVLSDEGLPQTPYTYFAAAITAIRKFDGADRESVAALSSFLSFVLPLVPMEFLPKEKAKDAAFIIALFLRDVKGGLCTGSLRSMVKSLGFVALRVDLEDWSAIELPFETLLLFAVDARPKVRRCAQSCLEAILKSCHDSSIIKKASKVVHRRHRRYIASVRNSCLIEHTDAAMNNNLSKPEHLEALHMLNVLNALIPYISEKIRMKILSDVNELLGCHFSWPTRHILRILETLMEHLDVKVLAPKAENVVSALTSYVSTAKKNPVDTIVSASSLLKNVLRKFGDAFPTMWIRYFPVVFASLIGYLESDSDASKLVADILKESIKFHVNESLFMLGACEPDNYEMESSSAAAVVASICTVSDKSLKNCSFPTEQMLEVMSVLFLNLGGSSVLFMKEVLITLSKYLLNADEKHIVKHLEQCIGAAVYSMGPEKVLSLIPLDIDIEKSICSNSWIIPILKKYVVGASLQYFMDNIVPLAKNIQEICKKVKEASIRKSMQSCFHNLWDLLPAFCRFPIDISKKIESLSKLLAAVLNEEPSLHEIIASALQVLIYSNRDDRGHCVEDPRNIFSQNLNMELKNFCYSKKVSSKNMKAMASSSLELFQILKDIFLDSPDERKCIKAALGSLGFVIPSECIRKFFLSEFKSNEKSKVLDSETLDDHARVGKKKVGEAETALEKNEERRCLLMELSSSFVEAADTDLTNTIFDLIKSSLLDDTNVMCQCEAYFTLSRILEEKDSYCSARLDELFELLFTVKPPVDASSLKNRFSCFEFLLVCMLKVNVDDMNAKTFLILNEILLTLKSKKESRKMAYDSLLAISGKLKTSNPDSADSDILRLFTMVMGYLSSSSPHIISAAVSALSLLIYKDAGFCLSVPNLIPSVLVLLQTKDNEVIKATLGFIKVLVSSLNSYELRKLLPEILEGVMPWFLVSKYHFRSKVGIIVEILIRKCSLEAVEDQTPDKHKGFVKSINEGRATRKLDKGADTPDSTKRSADSITKGGKKRLRDTALIPSIKPSKKPENGFRNKSSSKKLYKTFRSRATDAGKSNSHNQKKPWLRKTSSSHERNASSITKKQGQDKKSKEDKLSVKHKKSVASSRLIKQRRRNS